MLLSTHTIDTHTTTTATPAQTVIGCKPREPTAGDGVADLCVVCLDRPNAIRPFPCTHETCLRCASQLSMRLASCPLCRRENIL
eukprot:2415194-Prymnesium_polylepis.1